MGYVSAMATAAPSAEIKPISHRSTNDKVFELLVPRLSARARVADIGAGEGYFSKRVGDFVAERFLVEPQTVLAASDLVPSNFRYDRVVCDPIRDDGRLPYDDESFDVACSLEVIEHVEDQFAFTRELFRIVRPGGLAIVSTPNVLNLNSRVRNLHSGFGVLFDPLSLTSTDPVHTSGHIHPVSYYYLAYQLHRAGFRAVDVHFDRFKSSARALLVVWGALIAIGNAGFRRRLRRRKPDVERENEPILSALNSRQMLTARSVIAVGRK
jgi:SAM-dependent methyltransferase